MERASSRQYGVCQKYPFPADPGCAALGGNRADDPAHGRHDGRMSLVEIWPVAGIASPEAERRFLRYFWASLADWRPERWNLLLTAKADGDIVGVQEIGAQQFAVTRTVSTGSWIGRRYQGAGYGKAMREAVLHLAFDGLHAERADTAAWVNNHASLGVSRAVGYRDNGTTTRAAEGKRVEQVNLTLRRADWPCSPTDCIVTGITSDAAEMLGLPSTCAEQARSNE